MRFKVRARIWYYYNIHHGAARNAHRKRVVVKNKIKQTTERASLRIWRETRADIRSYNNTMCAYNIIITAATVIITCECVRIDKYCMLLYWSATRLGEKAYYWKENKKQSGANALSRFPYKWRRQHLSTYNSNNKNNNTHRLACITHTHNTRIRTPKNLVEK